MDQSAFIEQLRAARRFLNTHSGKGETLMSALAWAGLYRRDYHFDYPEGTAVPFTPGNVRLPNCNLGLSIVAWGTHTKRADWIRCIDNSIAALEAK